MNKTEEKIKKDKKSTEIIIHDRNLLIERGCYPSKFRLPVTIQFELTSNCNLRCKHCYNRSGISHHIDRMTSDKWIDFCKKIVDKGGILQATISGGEPLLLGDQLWEIMDILYEDNTVFNLISNGFLVDDVVIRHLRKYQFYWVQISIDSFRSDYHDEFRGVRGSWERAARAAYKIALSGIPLRIASTVTPRDLPSLEDYVKMAINLGATYFIIGEVMPSGRAFDNGDIFLSNEDRNCFYEEMEELQKKYKKKLSILVSGNTKVQLEYAASGGIDGAIIRPDGNVRLDCTAPFYIGNILEDDIEDIWQRKANCWQHPLVTEYIASCDPINGRNKMHENYNDADVFLS